MVTKQEGVVLYVNWDDPPGQSIHQYNLYRKSETATSGKVLLMVIPIGYTKPVAISTCTGVGMGQLFAAQGIYDLFLTITDASGVEQPPSNVETVTIGAVQPNPQPNPVPSTGKAPLNFRLS